MTTVDLPAEALELGHVLTSGGTVTSPPTLHPCGETVVEVDWSALRRWPRGTRVSIRTQEANR